MILPLLKSSSIANKDVACEQAHRGALAAGRKKLRLWILNSNSPVAPRRLSCQIFANQREAEASANVNNVEKHVPGIMTSLPMSSPPINISRRLFRCRFSNSRDVVASCPSFSCPAARAPRTACSQANKDV